MRTFVKGLDLCESYFKEVVGPLLSRHLPELLYSAARLNEGSDVMGFDTPQSMDHDWGPRVQLFLEENGFEAARGRIEDVLGNELPLEFQGFSTHFGLHADGTRHIQPTNQRPINHGVAITTTSRFFVQYLGVDPQNTIQPKDWLVIPQQHLRTVENGRVFHDGLGTLKKGKEALAWYSRDIWIHLLACQWRRIEQEAPFVGRCGDVGDDLGSKIVATRLVKELMKLCFLMERQYAPYSKWFGTAFARLEVGAKLEPVLQAVLRSEDWKKREAGLVSAYKIVIEIHNRLGLTDEVEMDSKPFHNRPYLVPDSGRVIKALQSAIKSEEVRALPKYIGSVDQIVDSTDVLDSIDRCGKLGILYEN